jgi:hypothetical protein
MSSDPNDKEGLEHGPTVTHVSDPSEQHWNMHPSSKDKEGLEHGPTATHPSDHA